MLCLKDSGYSQDLCIHVCAHPWRSENNAKYRSSGVNTFSSLVWEGPISISPSLTWPACLRCWDFLKRVLGIELRLFCWCRNHFTKPSDLLFLQLYSLYIYKFKLKLYLLNNDFGINLLAVSNYCSKCSPVHVTVASLSWVDGLHRWSSWWRKEEHTSDCPEEEGKCSSLCAPNGTGQYGGMKIELC